MGLKVGPSVAEATLQSIQRTRERMDKASERIASGLKLSRAADDPAGLSLSEKMRARIRSLQQASRNIEYGTSMTDVAEGGAEESNRLLVRMRELGQQASNSSISTGARASIEAELSQLKAELGRIADTGSFNGLSLSDGSQASISVQSSASAGASENISVALHSLGPTALGVADVSFDSVEAAVAGVQSVDEAIEKVSDARANYGVARNRLSSAWESLQVETENLVATESRIRDADLAEESAVLVREQVLQEAGIAVLMQSHFNNKTAQSVLT